MFIHRENALKAHQHILFYTCHFKKTILFNSTHAFISDKSLYYTGNINYNHRLLIIN